MTIRRKSYPFCLGGGGHGCILARPLNFLLVPFRDISTKQCKDKYGRIISKPLNRTKLKMKTVQRKSSASTVLIQNTSKLEKILSPINMAPKPVAPLPVGKAIASANAVSGTHFNAILNHNNNNNNNSLVLPSFYKRMSQWFANNYGILILNIGSLATLTGFTRTDILELRLLSITGSLSSVIYFLTRPPPFVYGSVIWSLIFASTNAYMVYYIYEERKGQIQPLTEEEKDLYEEHFMPHGVTPRQFEKLIQRAQLIHLKRGDILIQKGQELDSVYLVSSGATEAVGNLSRRITAASSIQGNKQRLKGGDSGAWVGEFLFLDYLRLRDLQGKTTNKIHTNKNTIELRHSPQVEDLVNTRKDHEKDVKSNMEPMAQSNEYKTFPSRSYSRHKSELDQNVANETDKKRNDLASTSKSSASILTYIATQDSKIYSWDYEDLATLLGTSSDLRSAVTRAMTAALVGKVVNLYISNSDHERQSSDWIQWVKDYWYASTGDIVKVNIVNENMDFRKGGISSNAPIPANRYGTHDQRLARGFYPSMNEFGTPSDK
jgi:CRP-like cAMP-binding protein